MSRCGECYKINGLRGFKVDSDARNISDLDAVRASCVLAGVLMQLGRVDGESHPAWCARHDPALLAFSPRQIIEAATDNWAGPHWQGAGVYFLIWDGQLVYVGRSGCVATRLWQHRKDGKPFQRVAAILGLSHVAAQEIEDAYSTAYCLPWNCMATNGFIFSAGLLRQLDAMPRDGIMPWFPPTLQGPAMVGLKKWQMHVIGRRQQPG